MLQLPHFTDEELEAKEVPGLPESSQWQRRAQTLIFCTAGASSLTLIIIGNFHSHEVGPYSTQLLLSNKLATLISKSYLMLFLVSHAIRNSRFFFLILSGGHLSSATSLLRFWLWRAFSNPRTSS